MGEVHYSRDDVEACRELLPGILRALGRPEGPSFTVTGDGVVNPTFLVEDRFYVKFNVRDPELDKFVREEQALQLAAGAGVPVPPVVLRETGRVRCPFEILVTARVEGRGIEVDLPDLDPDQRSMLSRQCGVLLARIHGCTLPSFGELGARGSGRSNAWDTYLEQMVEYWLSRCRPYEIFSPVVERRFHRVIDRYRSLLRTVRTPSLVHGDYQYNNILHAGGAVAAVLDFEWSLAGDPEFDLVELGTLESILPGSPRTFLDGYRSVRSLSPSWEEKVLLYECLHGVEIALVGRRYWSDEGFQSHMDRIGGLLDRLL